VTDRQQESENTSTKRWSKECRGRAGEKRVIEREWKSPSTININAKKGKETKRVWRRRIVSDQGSERRWPIHALIKKKGLEQKLENNTQPCSKYL
jgi:hypothetical protein